MPPHDRLCRRLNTLVSQTITHPPLRHHHAHHEPLLFLYPRWFATTTTPQLPLPIENQRKTPLARRNEETAVAGDTALVDDDDLLQAQGQAQGQAQRPIRRDRREKLDVNTRPSNRLVRRVVKKTDLLHKKDQRARELVKKPDYDLEDWRGVFDVLEKNTRQGHDEHTKQLEQLNMPIGMKGYCTGDLKELFLETYLLTSCHVQLPQVETETKHSFSSLILIGTPDAIKAAKVRLNDTITVRSVKTTNPAGIMGSYETTSQLLPNPLPLRATWSFNYQKKRPRRPVSQIQPPLEWSIISLANYVQDLVNSDLPRTDRQKSYSIKPYSKNQPSHVEAVSDSLLSIFTDPTLHEFISNSATTSAIVYLARHRKIPEIRTIIEALDVATPPQSQAAGHLTTAVFNACLRSAAKSLDMHNYRFLLQAMLSRSCMPNWETWASFLYIVHNRYPKASKQHIIRTMQIKGMVRNPQAKMAVANVCVYSDFTDWVSRGGSVRPFIDHYNRIMLGDEWLDVSVANKMVKVCCLRGQFTDALSIISVLTTERKRLPNTVTFNTVMDEATAQHNLSAVRECLRELVGSGDNPRMQMEDNLYTRLYLMARRTGNYNLCRVIWRYACLSGKVSWEVQNAFEKAIIYYAPTLVDRAGAAIDDSAKKYTDSNVQMFLKFGIKAAVGIEQSGSAVYKRQLSALALESKPASLSVEDRENGKESLATTTTVSELPSPPVDTTAQSDASLEATARKRLLRELVKHDMSVDGILKPKLPFVDMIDAAAARDAEWRKAGVYKRMDFEWMLDNMIEVPVEMIGFKAGPFDLSKPPPVNVV